MIVIISLLWVLLVSKSEKIRTYKLVCHTLHHNVIESKKRHSDANNIEHETETDTSNLIGSQIKITKEDFKIIKVIGRGTFGKVFMVKKKDTDDIYAMKVLKKEQIASKNL